MSSFLRNILKRQGYEVIPAVAADGVRLLRTENPGVALLITNLPGEFTEFADRVRLLYVAAFPDPRTAAVFRTCRTLSKPFHPEQLLTCVGELLGTM